MILRYQYPEGFLVDVDGTTVPLYIFLNNEREKRGMTIGALESRTGLNHPVGYYALRGKYQATRTLLMMLDTLGYDIRIQKRY